MASKVGMLTGSSSLAVAISTHCPSRSSNASRVRSVGSTSPRCPTPSRAYTGRLPWRSSLRVEAESTSQTQSAARVTYCGVGVDGHPLPAPSRKVGDQDVLAQVQLRLVDDPPTPGAAPTPAERSSELRTELRACQRMRHGGSGVGVECPVDDLGDALRDAASMIAMRSGDARRLLTDVSPFGGVISWFHSAFSHKQEKTAPAMASPALRSEQLYLGLRPEGPSAGSVERDPWARHREHARNLACAIEGRAVVVGTGAARQSGVEVEEAASCTDPMMAHAIEPEAIRATSLSPAETGDRIRGIAAIPGRQMIRERALHALRLEGWWEFFESAQEAHSVSLQKPILALI